MYQLLAVFVLEHHFAMNDLIVQITAIVGAFGGLELIKWLYNRKPSRKKAAAEASAVEADAEKTEIEALRGTIETLVETIKVKHDNNDWLQQQLQSKEERFAEQTQLVRRLNSEVLELTQKLADEILAHKMDECKDRDCPFRQPPKAYTPPPSGLSKEEYFKDKEN